MTAAVDIQQPDESITHQICNEVSTQPIDQANNSSVYQVDQDDVSRNFEWPSLDVSIDLLYKSMCVIQSNNASVNHKVDMTGMKVWPGAELMCEWFIYLQSINQLSNRLLELGAGTGVCSILAAKLPCVNQSINQTTDHLSKRFVVCTDGEEQVVRLIDRNIGRNGLTDQVVARKLYWGDKDHLNAAVNDLNHTIAQFNHQPNNQPIEQTFDCVFAADVCYPDTDRVAIDALFDTAKAIMTRSSNQSSNPSGNSQSIPFYLAYYHRSTRTSVEVIDCAITHGLSIKSIDRSILSDQISAMTREDQLGVRGYLLEFRLMNYSVDQTTDLPLAGSLETSVKDEFTAHHVSLMTSDSEWEERQNALDEVDDLPFGLVDD